MAAAADGAEPTLRDVMALLRDISGKVGAKQASQPIEEPEAKRARHGPKSPRLTASVPPGTSWACPTVIEKVLYKKEQIQQRVTELAAQVSADYTSATEDSFVVVGVLSGVYMLMADFTRRLTVPHQIDFIAASSYGLGTVSSANVKIKKDLEAPIAGKDVLVLDEMSDSGRSMACIKKMFQDRGARSVRCCVLLNKAARRAEEVDLDLDYVGFECPDEFVVGYGMDWANRFRSLEEIAVVRRSAYEK